MVDTPRSGRGALCMGVRLSPGPPDYTPVAELVDAARSKRASTCRFDSCREYCSPTASHAPDRTVTAAASKTAIRGSIPRGCAMWEMPKWTRRLFAKQLLPGSSPGSHSIGGREATANAFWSRKPALRERPGWGFDSSALRHLTKKLLSFLIS